METDRLQIQLDTFTSKHEAQTSSGMVGTGEQPSESHSGDARSAAG